jgi:hypothetical protein
MQHNFGRIVAAIFLMGALGIGLGIATGSMALLYGSGASAVVAMFIVSIAHLRPKGREPEHHPKVDQALDDTRP